MSSTENSFIFSEMPFALKAAETSAAAKSIYTYDKEQNLWKPTKL